MELIALNDEPLNNDAAEMAGFASVMLLAFLFSKNQRTVADDVVKCRGKLRLWESEAR